MLSANILNSSATYNSYNVIGTLEFIPGEQIRFVMQLAQPQHPNEIRYMTVAPATLTASFPTKTGTVAKVMTPLAEDRSIWEVTLEEADTADMISGTVTFDLDVNDDGTEIIKGLISSATFITLAGSC